MFIPVKPKGNKEQELEEKLDVYPSLPTIALCAGPKDGSKMLRLNRKAVEVLGLEVNNDKDRLAIVRGYEATNASQEKIFMYLTDKDDVEYVNEKRNSVKRSAAKVNLSTLRLKSTWIYDDLETFHSNDNFLEERYFSITEVGDGYFRLDDMSEHQAIIRKMEVVEKEIDSLFDSKGKEVNVTIHND
jgi:hypothetical protein